MKAKQDASDNQAPANSASIHSFGSIILGHRRLLEVKAGLLDALQQTELPSIIGVIGPAGVGKSTVLELVKNEILAHRYDQMVLNPACIPIANILVPATHQPMFDWREYYHCVLESLQEPLLEAKTMHTTHQRNCTVPGPSSKSTMALRCVLENSLRHRDTQILLIDEGQHLCRVAGKTTLQDVANHLEEMVIGTGTTHVLFGNMILIPMLRLIEQRAIQVKFIRFSPYKWQDKQDRLLFEQLVESFQQYALPFEETNHSFLTEYLYRGSCGCAGICKMWITDALHLAIENNSSLITKEHLIETAIEKAKLLHIAKEIHDEDGLDNKLFSKQTIQQKQRVGKRKPRSYPVGHSIKNSDYRSKEDV